MNGIMNKNQLTNVKEYEIINPPFYEVDKILSQVIADCTDIHFHSIEYRCV